MKRLIAAVVSGCTLLLSFSSVIAQPVAKQTTYALIVCESPNGQQSFCRADTQRGVQLVREISRNRCFEGRTFGYEEDGIWISGGCAAEFEIGRGGATVSGPGYGPGSGQGQGGPGYQDQVVTCESRDGRRAYCEFDTRGGVALVRQTSRSECIEGQTWGYDQRGVWVDRGCRAEFELRSSGGNYPPQGSPQYPPQGGPGVGQYLGRLECRSEGGRQQICPADIGRNRVELTRQISRGPCVQGQSWGYDQRGIWVSNGCRGEFAVVLAPPPRIVACDSVKKRRQYCPANTVYGVQLSRQLSRAACTEGYSWGYDRNAIWVDQGCRAEFLVE
jgi:hypothetical protein